MACVPLKVIYGMRNMHFAPLGALWPMFCPFWHVKAVFTGQAVLVVLAVVAVLAVLAASALLGVRDAAGGLLVHYGATGVHGSMFIDSTRTHGPMAPPPQTWACNLGGIPP